jgi:hypothetical protein
MESESSKNMRARNSPIWRKDRENSVTENNIKIVLGEGFGPNTKITKAEITFSQTQAKAQQFIKKSIET